MPGSDEDHRRRPSVLQVQLDLSGDQARSRFPRRSVLLVAAAGVALALLLTLVLVLPEVLLRSTVSADGERLLKARSDLRGQLLQAVGALFFIVTAVLSWRQLRNFSK